MLKIYLKSLALFLLLLSNAYSEKPVAPDSIPGANTVDAKQVIELILTKPDIVIIDSRKDSEYTKGHIQGAINLLDTKMTKELLHNHVPMLQTPILFYCNGERCLRSSRATTQAMSWGYTEVYWFRKGWNDWLEQGFPINY